MTEKWIDVKFPKEILYIMTGLFILSHVLFVFYLFIIINDPRTGTGIIIDIGLLIFLLSVGWGTSLFLFLRIPKSVYIKDNELLLKNRIGKIKKMTRKQIHKVRLVKTFMTGEFACSIHHNRKKPEYSFGIDFEAGKKVYDWYYGIKDENVERPIKNFYWRNRKK